MLFLMILSSLWSEKIKYRCIFIFLNPTELTDPSKAMDGIFFPLAMITL